jgi:hypothetical protein
LLLCSGIGIHCEHGEWSFFCSIYADYDETGDWGIDDVGYNDLYDSDEYYGNGLWYDFGSSLDPLSEGWDQLSEHVWMDPNTDDVWVQNPDTGEWQCTFHGEGGDDPPCDGGCDCDPAGCEEPDLCETFPEICEDTDPCEGMYADPCECGGDCDDPKETETPQTVAPKATKIFRNSNMTLENWKKLEKMIEKIEKDCLGAALYDGLEEKLDGKRLIIQFNSGNDSEFGIYDGSISISILMESNHLFHEMWHVYQAYQETETSFMSSVINQEIETWYSQYLYVNNLPEYQQGSKWANLYKSDIGKYIRRLEKYIDNNGNLKPGKTELELEIYLLNGPVNIFKHPNSPYKDYIYDGERDGLQNFKNLKELSKDC